VLAPVLRVLSLVPLKTERCHLRSVYIQCNENSTAWRCASKTRSGKPVGNGLGRRWTPRCRPQRAGVKGPLVNPYEWAAEAAGRRPASL
jgi:hypothetical protein